MIPALEEAQKLLRMENDRWSLTPSILHCKKFILNYRLRMPSKINMSFDKIWC